MTIQVKANILIEAHKTRYEIFVKDIFIGHIPLLGVRSCDDLAQQWEELFKKIAEIYYRFGTAPIVLENTLPDIIKEVLND